VSEAYVSVAIVAVRTCTSCIDFRFVAKQRSPEEVFTPARPVSDEMFATRQYEHLQDRVEAALNEEGRPVVLFGLTGVGKTSLLEYLCRNRDIKRIRVECGGTFEG